MSKPARPIITFESEVAKPLINAELRIRKKRKQKAALRSICEEAVFLMLGQKFPKLVPSDLANTHPSLFLALQGSRNPTSVE